MVSDVWVREGGDAKGTYEAGVLQTLHYVWW